MDSAHAAETKTRKRRSGLPWREADLRSGAVKHCGSRNRCRIQALIDVSMAGDYFLKPPNEFRPENFSTRQRQILPMD
jgi:hypothetical protein